MLCESKAKADAEAVRIRKDGEQLGASWMDIPAADRHRLAQMWKAGGVDGLSVKTSAPTRTLSEVAKELESSKNSSGCNERYVNCMMSVLNQFIKGRNSLPIGEVTLNDIVTHLNSFNLSYRSTVRARISTLFNFALRREYIEKNPCDQLDEIIYHKPPPQILTPEQLKKCLQWLTKNPRGSTWFVLTTLCGLRPEEAQKTPRDKIQCLAGHIIVDSQTTKVRQRRVVTPMPEAMKWLRRSLKYGGLTPINQQFKRRLILKLRTLIGFKEWPQDITRHTAASIWLARIKSAAEVAEQLGNSEKVLKRDYKALVTAKLLGEYLTVIRNTVSRKNQPAG
ncbi:MAG: hypothetical protein QM813_26445 [Verrucomicrobiota bacterium]